MADNIKYTRLQGPKKSLISRTNADSNNVRVVRSIRSNIVIKKNGFNKSINKTRQVPNTKQRLTKRLHTPSNKIHPDAQSILNIKGIKSGKVLVIVGNGPSHRKAPLDKLKKHSNIEFMSINKPDPRIWPTQLWCFCDNSQLRRHRELWTSYSGILVNSSAVRERKPGSISIRSLSGQGFSEDLTKGFFIGRSSVYASMQLANWMGYDHIYIFGCDMAADEDGMLYPWGSNPDVSDDTRIKRFEIEAKFYQWAADNLRDTIRSKYTFCTNYNEFKFIDQFGRLDHNKAVDIILDRHGAN